MSMFFKNRYINQYVCVYEVTILGIGFSKFFMREFDSSF